MKTDAIPVQTVFRPLGTLNNSWVAKSAVKFKNWQDRTLLVHGFSWNECKERAAEVSRAEVFERLFAHYDFVRKDVIPWHQWPGEKAGGFALASEIMLGPLPQGRFSDLDASGLGWNTDMKKAQSHAILEIIERHLLCLLWYHKFPLKKIGSTSPLGEKYHVEFSTLDRTPPIPFSLAVIANCDKSVWVCGAAVRQNLAAAKSKALSEAILFLDGILHQDDVSLNPNPKTQWRLQSLRDPLVSKKRSAFYEARVCVGGDLPESRMEGEMNVDEICRIVFGKNFDMRIALLRQEEDGCLVRALCPQAYKLKDIRKELAEGIPSDPFC